MSQPQSQSLIVEPFRSILSTVASYIFGHRVASPDGDFTNAPSRKHGRDDSDSDSDRERTIPAAAVTPSPPARKRRRRTKQRRRRRRKKMVLSASDSCNTLVSLQGTAKANATSAHHLPLDRQLAREEEPAAGAAEAKKFRATRILLPADDYDFSDDDDEDEEAEGAERTAYNSGSRTAEPETLYLPVISSPSSDGSTTAEEGGEEVQQEVDRHLSTIPSLVDSSESLLSSSPPVRLSSRNCSGVRVLNVLQGEIGHCPPSQADVVVSDRATTCHILALRSTGGCEEECAVSLAHIDRAGYGDCLRGAVQLHKNYHRSLAVSSTAARNCSDSDEEEEKKTEDDEDLPHASPIEMDVHIVGGYSDPDGSSASITSSLLSSLATLADEEAGSVNFTLRTCAVGRLNDDNLRGGPVGRGLAMNTSTGQVFLASVDKSVAGPMLSARSARLWSRDRTARPELSCVHSLPSPPATSSGERTSSSSESGGLLNVRAFKYEAFPEISPILRLGDDVLLQYTSTSPDVEEDGFCDDVRSTLRFIRDTRARDVFGEGCDEDVVWRRSEEDVNRWEAVRRP